MNTLVFTDIRFDQPACRIGPVHDRDERDNNKVNEITHRFIHLEMSQRVAHLLYETCPIVAPSIRKAHRKH